MKLTTEEKELLLSSARRAIETHFRKEDANATTGGVFDEELGVFVTLKELGRLQGCCGFPYPTTPLGRALIEAARNAAFHDPRFTPLRTDQLERITIDVSVLTEPELVMLENRNELPNTIRVGVDGLIIRDGMMGGLLLPVVATEYAMDGVMFLEAICHKAGLPPDSWREPSCDIYTFQATVVSEKDA